MNTLIIISALLAVAFSKPLDGQVSLNQDTAGNYNLNYNTADASRQEQGFEGGKVVGTFTFQDKEGQHHTIRYLAAPEHGFTAEGDLPAQVQETPEVAAARASHLAVQAHERAILPPLREEVQQNFAPAAVHHFAAPAPSFQQHGIIDNTAEIEAVKAEHFAAHQHALAHLANAYKSLA